MGDNYSGTVQGCTATGVAVTGMYAGGVVGYNEGTVYKDCTYDKLTVNNVTLVNKPIGGGNTNLKPLPAEGEGGQQSAAGIG